MSWIWCRTYRIDGAWLSIMFNIWCIKRPNLPRFASYPFWQMYRNCRKSLRQQLIETLCGEILPYLFALECLTGSDADHSLQLSWALQTEAVNELQCCDDPLEEVIAQRASSLFPAAPPSAWVATSLALMGDSIDLG